MNRLHRPGLVIVQVNKGSKDLGSLLLPSAMQVARQSLSNCSGPTQRLSKIVQMLTVQTPFSEHFGTCAFWHAISPLGRP
jgi:hypothetical protein